MRDGIIKFNISNWERTKSFSKELWSDLSFNRKKLFNIGLIGFDNKLKLGFGNISKRLDNNSFIITGSQTGNIQYLEGRHFSVIQDIDLKLNSVKCKGHIKPSSESITHGVCYLYNNKINSVIHIHSSFLWNILIKNKKILSTPESAGYGSTELSFSLKNIVENMKINEPEIIVMRGHEDGIIIIGGSLKNVTEKTISLYNSYK